MKIEKKELELKKQLSKVFDQKDYEGATPSSLCLGCGHDQISKHIMKAFYEASIDPFSIAKISGIGCSSKTPNYFLKQARGFNTIHGRMASIATGVKVANRDLKVIGISGDGDTGSIGLGSFLHTMRKNIPLVYIVENNGVYGLTKGQFSATAKKNSTLKYRETNPFYEMNLCQLALDSGCGFVARSFSGDTKQLTQLLKLALTYEGFAFIDVISPCVAYGNEDDFAYSFRSMKKEKQSLHDLDIILDHKAINKEYKEKETQKIPLPNGRFLLLKKLGNTEHDPTQKHKAWALLESSSAKKEMVTGLIYYKEQENFLEKMELSEQALVSLKEAEISPPAEELTSILDNYS